MGIEMRQQLKLSQSLVMTPQLQQAIKLLQLSRTELVDLVREEMLENPVLEDEYEKNSEVESRPSTQSEMNGDEPPAIKEVKGDENALNEIDWENYINNYQTAPSSVSSNFNHEELPSIEATYTGPESLSDHLDWQIRMSDLTEEQRDIAEVLLGNIDADGYIKEPPLDHLATEANATLQEVETVLMKMQSFDPIGIGARSLAECMLIQAMHYGEDDDLIVKIIKDHLSNLERKNYQAIAKDTGEPLEEVYEAIKVIMEFDPKPGRQYSSEDPHYITPDVHVHKVGERYFVISNDDGMPKLKISKYYQKAVGDSENAKEYIQDKMRSAQWLIRSIQQRQRTIIRVMESILKFQYEFFDKGVSHLKPLILKDVAEDIEMHESTISRVTSNKYVHTPQGIFELKYFFSSGISRTNGEDLASQAVKSKIKSIIDEENPKKPMSDQKIAVILKDRGIDIARRTVAKYREQMGILSSSKRKQVF